MCGPCAKNLQGATGAAAVDAVLSMLTVSTGIERAGAKEAGATLEEDADAAADDDDDDDDEDEDEDDDDDDDDAETRWGPSTLLSTSSGRLLWSLVGLAERGRGAEGRETTAEVEGGADGTDAAVADDDDVDDTAADANGAGADTDNDNGADFIDGGCDGDAWGRPP
jgi:hypothetical protein